MAFENFNSVAGYSIGIPPVEVIDSNGVFVSNVLTSGNVVANVIRGTTFLYANGAPFVSPPAGSNTQVQFNNNGVLGASANFTFISTTNTLQIANLLVTNGANLGNVSNITILGGLNGYFLQTDGAGNLSWAAGGGNGGNGNPGGANTQVQFNDAGTFGGDSGFTYNKVTNTLTVENISAGNSPDDILNVTGNLSVVGNISATNANLGNAVVANYFIGNGSLLTGLSTDIANYVAQPNQANITSVGTLTGLDLIGNITSTANIAISGNINAGNLSLSRNVTASSATFTSNVTVGNTLTVNSSGTLRVLGNVNTAGSPNINLGTLSNIHISGGTNGYVLSTDGLGNLSWVVGGGGGGNGSPAGSNTQIQYNNAGSFGASPYLTFDDFTTTLTLAGNLVANTFQIGTGIYHFCTSRVYFSTTNSTTANQVLYSVGTAFVSSVDFTIIATDSTAGTRQTSKISATFYNGNIAYNEYAGLQINGGVGSFSVDYFAGNIVTPPSYQLLVTPDSNNLTNYKLLVVEYAQ